MQKDFMVADIHMLKPCGCAFLNTTTLTQCNCHHAASGKAAQRTQGRKRKQVLISDDEESQAEESSPDSGSDWSQSGKKDAASPDGDDDDDDDVSMADEEEDYPTRRQKTPTVAKVWRSCVREPTAIYISVQALLHHYRVATARRMTSVTPINVKAASMLMFAKLHFVVVSVQACRPTLAVASMHAGV